MTTTQPWDQDVTWYSRLVTPATEDVFGVDYVLEKVLRVADGGYDREFVRQAMRAATTAAEHATDRALMPQTWQMVLSAFPCGPIVLQRPPLIEVTSIEYVDVNGDTQTLLGSPADFLVVNSGRYAKAQIVPLYGESWPTTRAQPNAVTVTYQAGYEDESDPDFALIKAGIGLFIGELYKNRGLSVQAMSGSVPAQLQLDAFWKPVVG